MSARLWLRYRRPLLFAAVGGTAALSGFMVLVALVSGLGVSPTVAYIVQAVVAVELNFLLNRAITWRDRPDRFWTAWWRFHAARSLTIALDQTLFNLLVLWLSVPYWFAHPCTVLIITVLNYQLSSRFVFARRLGVEDGKAVTANCQCDRAGQEQRPCCS